MRFFSSIFSKNIFNFKKYPHLLFKPTLLKTLGTIYLLYEFQKFQKNQNQKNFQKVSCLNLFSKMTKNKIKDRI